MKAVALTRYLAISDSESLIDVELEKPTPSAHDLLIRIEAIGMNPIDTKVRAPKDQVEKTPRECLGGTPLAWWRRWVRTSRCSIRAMPLSMRAASYVRAPIANTT